MNYLRNRSSSHTTSSTRPTGGRMPLTHPSEWDNLVGEQNTRVHGDRLPTGYLSPPYGYRPSSQNCHPSSVSCSHSLPHTVLSDAHLGPDLISYMVTCNPTRPPSLLSCTRAGGLTNYSKMQKQALDKKPKAEHVKSKSYMWLSSIPVSPELTQRTKKDPQKDTQIKCSPGWSQHIYVIR